MLYGYSYNKYYNNYILSKLTLSNLVTSFIKGVKILSIPYFLTCTDLTTVTSWMLFRADLCNGVKFPRV